jgi:hypothetical protein
MKRKLLFLLLIAFAIAAGVPAAAQQPDLIKRGGAITVKVASYPEAQKALYELVTQLGGTAADRLSSESEKGKTSGWSRVRVPKAALDRLMAGIRSMGIVYGERLSLKDDSETYLMLGKRAERLKQHQQRLSGILESQKRLRGSDILYVQERLFRASVDEDTLMQTRQGLADSATTSSVIVTFFEPKFLKEPPRGILGHVKAAFSDAFRGLALAALGSIGTVLTLLIYLIVGWVLWRIFRRPIREAFRKTKAFFEPTAGTPVVAVPPRVVDPE